MKTITNTFVEVVLDNGLVITVPMRRVISDEPLVLQGGFRNAPFDDGEILLLAAPPVAG